MRYAARTDANQREVVDALRAFGATVLVTSQLKNAFDILVGYRGSTYLMEIKDGEKSRSATKLTDGEIKCAESFAKVGVPYWIVYSAKDAIDIILGKNDSLQFNRK